MTPLVFLFVLFLISTLTGLLGALLGLGGGLILIPVLTLLMGLPIHYAIGASIVSVIATSSGAAVRYIHDRFTNLRLAMLLELATTAGAISGAFLAGYIAPRWLYILFALLMLYTAIALFFHPHETSSSSSQTAPDPWSQRLRLQGHFFDQASDRPVTYTVRRVPLGLIGSYLAGILSGLLGVGGGLIKVPLMNLAMAVPLKAAAATSNFMIGVTAAASAAVYFVRGDVHPWLTAPVALGISLGAVAGSHLMTTLPARRLRLLLMLVLLWTALQMFLKGLKT